MKHHIIITIFGVTGDLARKKLIPALYHLCKDNLEGFSIIGVGQQAIDQEIVLEAARIFVEEINPTIWISFKQIFQYFQADITRSDDMNALAEFIQKHEQLHLPVNKLFYFAVPSTVFGQATILLARSGLLSRLNHIFGDEWIRVGYEKPFGHDTTSAQALNQVIRSYLEESQIFRIDHYLAKDPIKNIQSLRFDNSVWQAVWNSQFIDQVHIVLNETGGIAGRGTYYDGYGIIKDVVQNHILQIITLVAMEQPKTLYTDEIQAKRCELLENVHCEDVIFGQYEGYTEEDNIKHNSVTPTFALIKCKISTDRWTEVPFFITTGKYLLKAETAVHIKFKAPSNSIKTDHVAPSSWLSLRFSPEPAYSFTCSLDSSQKPELIEQAVFICDYFKNLKTRNSQPYETVFGDIITGKHETSVHYDEIEKAWQITQQIEKDNRPVHSYKKGSQGPENEIDLFAKKHGIYWWPGKF